MIIDTHAHYDDEQFDPDRNELLKSMEAGGIGLIVHAGSTVASWGKIVKLTEEYPFMYGAIGVHPDEVGSLDEEQFARMSDLLDLDKIIAVGEIGLDYYWDKEKHDIQKKWFIRQLELAREKNMPVIIHSREAAAHDRAVDAVAQVAQRVEQGAVQIENCRFDFHAIAILYLVACGSWGFAGKSV